MGKYDTSTKKVINMYNQAWAEWVLQHEQITVEAELSGEFQFVARANDSLLRVTGQSGTFLVLTELQFSHQKTMPERLAAYKLLAQQKYGLDVFVTVIYFLPPPEGVTPVTAYHEEFMGQLTHVDFQVIKLWELAAKQVMAYDNPMLLPFVPLMQGGADEQVVRQCATRIRETPNAAELETILAIFASYVLDPKVIKQIVRWEMNVFQKSPIIEEMKKVWVAEGLQLGIEQGRQEGRQEGRQKGELNTRIKTLNQILAVRFQVEEEPFAERLAKLSLPQLEQLTTVALTCPAVAEFEAALSEMEATNREA